MPIFGKQDAIYTRNKSLIIMPKPIVMVTAISCARLELFCKIITTSQSNHINSCITILLY